MRAPKFQPAMIASFFAVGCVLLLASACNKTTSSGPAPLPVAEIPATVQGIFNQASDGAKAASDGYVSAVQANDATKAFTELMDLSARKDLTPEQRGIAARAMVTTAAQLREAAENGDARAAAALHNYIATK